MCRSEVVVRSVLRGVALGDQQSSSSRRAGAVDVAVGARIKAARVRASLSLEQLATRVDLSTQQLFKYENGSNRITVGRLIAVADALGVEIETLLGRSRSPSEREGPRHDEVVRLVTGFCSIKKSSSREKILELVEFFASFETPSNE